MAGKSVAIHTDASPTAGSTFPDKDAVVTTPPIASGAWTPGALQVIASYTKLTIGGQPAISSVSCEFSFIGLDSGPGNPPPAVVTYKETVTLSAADLGTTKLQNGEQQVLRHGDQVKSSYGNAIKISSSGKLKSG